MAKTKKRADETFDVDIDPRLVAVIRKLYGKLESFRKDDTRLAFIRQSRRYAQQDGFDGDAVFRSLVVYILVVSKYSVLRSVIKTNTSDKKSAKKSITKAARLISQNADREKLERAVESICHRRRSRIRRSFDAAWYAEKAVDNAKQSATEFTRSLIGGPSYYNGARAESAVEWAVSAAVASAQYGAESISPHQPVALYDLLIYTDYAKALLKIMKKEAERAKRKSNPKKKATKKRSKRSKKKATKKNPTGNLRIGSVVNGWWVERISKYEGIPQTIALYTDLHGARHYLTIDYNITSGAQPKATSLEASLRRANEGFLGSKEFKSDSPSSDINKATKWAVTESFFTKKNPPKKKATKKKATRKKTPPWQLLINRCRKLWDDYCERPSKKRLKPVLEHLEKMKASTSKKVADERKSCLRIANKEARRLKMK